MLRRTPSLAGRAGLVFMAVYAAILLAVVGASAALSWADRGADNLRGAVLAVDYAAADLRQADGRLQLRADGRFARLAARNPSLWLVVLKDGRSYRAGAINRPALETVERLQGVVESVVFRVPGVAMPLGAGALHRRDAGFGLMIVAAGGVDPATLTTVESIHLLLEPEVALMLAIIAALSLLGTVVALPFFARALGPITAEAAAIGPQTPGRRLEEGKSPRELLPLVRVFNAALDRLEVELGRRKRFVVDVAHELRTPLAVVSLQVESLGDAERKEDLRRGLQRLTHLVAQMLDLERLSLSGRPCSNVDLVAIARDMVADLAPMAIDRGFDLSLAAPDTPVTVTGDPHAIARALTNLIGNSVVHGGGAGQIRVIVGADRTIDVEDDGPGVPADLQPRVFEPFARGDPTVDGCGLGLHLTREIMRAHGGDVSMVPGPETTTFRLAFPPHGSWHQTGAHNGIATPSTGAAPRRIAD